MRVAEGASARAGEQPSHRADQGHRNRREEGEEQHGREIRG